MELPQKSIVSVYLSNGRSFMFQVDGIRLETYRQYGYAYKCFRSINSAHRYCSAYGNIQSVYVQKQEINKYWLGPTIAILTPGQFLRCKLEKIAEPIPQETLKRTETLDAPSNSSLQRCNAVVNEWTCRCGVSPPTQCGSCYPGKVCERIR